MRHGLAIDGWNVATIGFAGLALVLAGLAAIDRRRLDGENTWSKPFKFAVSLVIHFATFAVLARCLPPRLRDGGSLVSSLIVALAAAVFAQGYITVQAGRRRRSHFNTTTRIEATMLAITGLCAVAILAPSLVIGLDAAGAPLFGWTAGERAGVAIGLLAGAVLTAMTGMQMGGAGSHFPGPPAQSPAPDAPDRLVPRHARPAARPLSGQPHDADRPPRRRRPGPSAAADPGVGDDGGVWVRVDLGDSGSVTRGDGASAVAEGFSCVRVRQGRPPRL